MATQVEEAQRDALAERLFGAALGAYELMTVHLGDRLGYYRALAEAGEVTSAELAAATGTDERYAREWLEQQAVAAILEVDDVEAAAGERRYRLPAAHAEVLVDRDSLAHLTPMARYSVSFAQALPAVEEAFRSGGGCPGRTLGASGAMRRPMPTGRSSPIFWAWSGCPRSPTFTSGCSPTRRRGSPTSPAAGAGPASRSRAPTRR